MARTRIRWVIAVAAAVALAGVTASVGTAQGPGNNAVRPLVVNQTEGFAEGQNQVFTYGQNFHCTVEPFDDLDGLVGGPDGNPAASDPAEMFLPECVAGETAGGSLPEIDPAGVPTKDARKFWAIVPVFDGGHGIPAAYDPAPNVHLQCPEPGPPTTENRAPVGSCTMHPNLVYVDAIAGDVSRSLAGVDLPPLGDVVPPVPFDTQTGAPVAVPGAAPGLLVPLPGHSHITETTQDETIWWQVIVSLVTDRTVWPDADGNCPAGRDACLTSLDALRAAQEDGEAGRDIPTNIWLFFANQPLEDHAGH